MVKLRRVKRMLHGLYASVRTQKPISMAKKLDTSRDRLATTAIRLNTWSLLLLDTKPCDLSVGLF